MIFRAIAFGTVAVIAGTLGVWTIDRQPPTVVLRTEVLSKPIRPGEDLRIKYTVHRFRSCETTIDRTLFDADFVRVVLDEIAFASAPGPLGESSYVAPVPIPRNFARGLGQYRVVSRYICNPLHRLWPIVFENQPVYFEVHGEPLLSAPLMYEATPRR
jgi:hypothetical protein